MDLAYDGHYTSDTSRHLRPHSLAADCNHDGPLKVAPPLPQHHPCTICQPALTSWVYCMSPLYGPMKGRDHLFKCPTARGGVHGPGKMGLELGCRSVD